MKAWRLWLCFQKRYTCNCFSEEKSPLGKILLGHLIARLCFFLERLKGSIQAEQKLSVVYRIPERSPFDELDAFRTDEGAIKG